MNINDWQVFVRDRSLKRVGQLSTNDLTAFTFCPTLSGVGVWTLTLPAAAPVGTDGPVVPHVLCKRLREEGAGIVVTFRGKTIFSGPMETPAEKVTAEHPHGEWTFTGPSDEVILEDALAWPDPAMATPQQARYANDTMKGQASMLLWSYIHRNIGSGAPSTRRGALAASLVTDIPPVFGPWLSMSPRYQNLLELCQEIAAQSGVSFRVVDEAGVLRLRIFDGRDRTRAVRWTVGDGFLESLTSEVSAPGVTRPIVAGQGDGAARTIVTPTTIASIDAENRWGRKIEAFVDQRQTDDLSELTQKGLESLVAEAAGIEVTPSPESVEGWPDRWDLGDLITVRTESHGDLVYPVTELPISIGPAGIEVSAVLGTLADDVGAQRSTGSRVSNLERNSSPPSVQDTPWAPLPINTALFQAYAGHPPQWRIFGGKLCTRGAVQPKSGTFTTAVVTILPAGAFPNLPALRNGYYSTRVTLGTSGQAPMRTWIAPDGSMTAAALTPGGTAGYVLLNAEYIYE